MDTYTHAASRRNLSVITASLSVWLCASATIFAAEHKLTVSRHTDIAFTNANADAKLAGATTVLKTDDNDCTDEVACCVTMSRNGAVAAVGVALDGLDVITSDTELAAVFALAGNIKVVTAASNCCGVAGSILGCGKMNLKNFIILKTTDADIWAHEFGHNQGLNHRDDCLWNIMHSKEPNTTAVNAAECVKYKAGGTMRDNVADECAAPIPAVSEWGLVTMTLVTLTVGTLLILKRRLAPMVC